MPVQNIALQEAQRSSTLQLRLANDATNAKSELLDVGCRDRRRKSVCRRGYARHRQVGTVQRPQLFNTSLLVSCRDSNKSLSSATEIIVALVSGTSEAGLALTVFSRGGSDGVGTSAISRGAPVGLYHWLSPCCHRQTAQQLHSQMQLTLIPLSSGCYSCTQPNQSPHLET